MTAGSSEEVVPPTSAASEVLLGSAAPPRTNGELIFDAPWQMRAFGLAAELVESGAFGWNDFRDELIAAIDRWNEAASSPSAGEWAYYERWAEALEAVIGRFEVIDAHALDELSAKYAARPHGHDH